MRLYLSIVFSLNVFPNFNKTAGKSSIANMRHASRTCRFCTPIPSIHGSRTNKMMTEMIFRVKTTPTSASPTIYDWSVWCETKRRFATHILITIGAVCKSDIKGHNETETKDTSPNSKDNPINTLILLVKLLSNGGRTYIGKTDTKNQQSSRNEDGHRKSHP